MLHGKMTSKEMRVIVRRERSHPGAQLRFGDVDCYRLTAFATSTCRRQLQTLGLRHRRRARCEDRIRQEKATGLRNLHCTGSIRTGSGARSSLLPVTSSPGSACSPTRSMKPADGNRNGSGAACSRPRGPENRHRSAALPLSNPQARIGTTTLATTPDRGTSSLMKDRG